jgi:tetratricopeptide (TPR) repeat protein
MLSLQDQAKQLMARHDWWGAIPFLERDIDAHPSDPWSRMFLGSCHYELRHYDVALGHFSAAEQLAPGESIPIGLQGDVFESMGDHAKAGELYQKALAMNPDDDLAKKNLQRWQSARSA